MRTAKTTLLVLTVVALARLAFVYPDLPDRVPSHFDAAGAPDGWSSRTEFVVLFAFLFLLMAGTFSGTSWMIRKLPERWINLPNKQYWLAASRRQNTLDDLDRRMHWMGVASVGLMLALFEMSIRVALGGSEGLPSPLVWILTVVFLVVITAQSLAILLRYGLKPKDPEP